MRPFFSLGLVSALFAGVACSGQVPGVGADGGALPDGALVLPDGAVADAGACPPAPTVLLAAKGRKLAAAGDSLVFVDGDAGGPFYPGAAADSKTYAIRKVGFDGANDATLYTPSSLHQINDLRVAGTTAYFLESERLSSGGEVTRIFSIPVAGGAPRLIAFHADPEIAGENDRLDAIVGVDATSLYVVRALTLGAIVWRVTIATGAESLVYRGQVSSSPELVGADLFFRTSALPVGNGVYAVTKLPTATTTTAPVALGTASCKGGLAAGEYGLLCTGAKETDTRVVSRFSIDGTGQAPLFTPPERSGRTIELGPVADGFVYLLPEGSNTSREELLKVPLGGGVPSVVACDRAAVPRRGDFMGGGTNSAIVSTLDMIVAGGDLVWTETSKAPGEPEKTAIYRTRR